MRRMWKVMAALAVLASPALAEGPAVVPAVPGTEVSDTPWQAVIAGQIDAFRQGDGPTALSFAATPFKKSFADPAQFLAAIVAWGYGPLMTSRSQSFGDYSQIAPDEVVQAVTVVGADMRVYAVVYDLLLEADGWRIKAVQMQKTAGLGA